MNLINSGIGDKIESCNMLSTYRFQYVQRMLYREDDMRHCGPPPTGQFGLTTPTTLHDALMDVLQSKQIWTDEHTALLQTIAKAATANGNLNPSPPTAAPVHDQLAPTSTTFSCMDAFLLLKREKLLIKFIHLLDTVAHWMLFIAALKCLSAMLTDLGGSAVLQDI